MAISDKINSIKTHISEAYTAIQGKEGTVPANKNCENLKDAIASIPTSGKTQEKTVNITENGVIITTPDTGYDGMSSVTTVTNVQPDLQEKAVTPTESQQIITPDAGYDGLNKVTVDAIQTEEVTVTPAQGQQVLEVTDNKYYKKVTVEAIPPDYVIPSGTIQITENGVVDVSGKANANVNVPSKEEETKEVDLAMADGNQTITPTSGKVLSGVTVKKPATMLPENIKKDVNIGGVTGTLETQKDEEAGTATITENGSQTFSPTSGKVFSDFTVTTNVPTGVDTDDATAVASDILSGKTAYAKGVKLTGSVETYNGAFVVKASWKASVSNLGARDPNTVVFNTPEDSVPKPWSEVEFNGDVFIKFPKMYKKIVTITDNQITAFEIANAKLDDDYKLYPCFIDESGNELDYILVGKYMSKSSDTCNSVAAGEPIPQTISNGREKARAKETGYQLMDWRIQRLWQDLIICVMKTVNINSGSGITTDDLGLYWGSKAQWVDGFCRIDGKWIYSNSPSKYIDSPTEISDGYAAISVYTAPTNQYNIEISKLGYDTSQPFFNYPRSVWVNSSYNTYYCDAYYSRHAGNTPIATMVGLTMNNGGAFNCYSGVDWSRNTYNVRLCYRPISS